MDRPTRLVVDAGPLYALVDRDDPNHSACLDLLESAAGSLFVPQLTIAEVAHFIGRRLRPQVEFRFVAEFAVGNLIAEPVHASDWVRIAELVEEYADLPLGTVDASVIAAAERLGATTIATLDRRHFSVVRPRHVEAFEILPQL